MKIMKVIFSLKKNSIDLGLILDINTYLRLIAIWNLKNIII